LQDYAYPREKIEEALREIEEKIPDRARED